MFLYHLIHGAQQVLSEWLQDPRIKKGNFPAERRTLPNPFNPDPLQQSKERFMKQKLPLRMLSCCLLLSLAGCAIFKSGMTEDKLRGTPHADREFRAAWVATVANIDWPSKPGLSTSEQQRQARAILDTAVSLHLNAVVFQVRPHCDAMYASQIEPWSSYLTGTQGKAPEPYYDPLTYWVEEAHKRGIELHVWFNPYRALMSRGGEPSEKSIVKTRPDLAKKLKDGMYWLDPSKKDVQDLSYNVVMDVVKRYDIDGVHFDDYFYPYGDGTFPDDDSWAEYTKSGGSLSREDWRRAAVNTFIERVYKGIKKEKMYVKLGISPFGIWRPGYPASITGFDQYNGLYADAKLWLNNGWVDYWTPQLYWPVNQIPQSFPVLMGWWAKQNTQGRNFWPGMSIGRGRDEKGVDETINQIMISRGFVPDGPGQVFFSMKSLMRDSSMLTAGLKNGPYRREALVPSSPWLDNDAPDAPRLDAGVTNDTIRFSWTHENTPDVFRWVVYYQYGKTWEYTIVNKDARTASIPLNRIVREVLRGRQAATEKPKETVETITRVALSAVDRVGNESKVVYHDITPLVSAVGK
jgi:uncharacterized lipoprotein YddW (UPF0748 family)